MKRLAIAILCIGSFGGVTAQTKKVYTISADSVKITYCDSAELIIENHTRDIHGFLYNTDNGRTIFKHGAQNLGGGAYLIGSDTLRVPSNAWVQGGNTFATTGVLGTQDNNHLDLYTNDSLRARITKTGNLVIGGTTDNGTKLQVTGSLSVSPPAYTDGAGGYKYITMSNGGMIGGYIHHMVFQVPDPLYGYYFEFAPSTYISGPTQTLTFNGGGSTTANIVVSSPSNFIDLRGVQNISLDASGLYLTSGGYSGMDGVVVQRSARSTNMTDPLFTVRENSDSTIFQALKNGNVGVGTKTPTAQLHTTGTVRFAGLSSNNTQTRVLVSDTSGNLYYRDASTLAADEPIRSSLAVNGPIKAQELTLTAKDWPDYVFDSSYALPALAGVKDYIRQHHHLQGLPAAGEVEQAGADVGATQEALLKKIEELTLYILNQDKEIKELKQLILTKLNNK